MKDDAIFLAVAVRSLGSVLLDPVNQFQLMST